MTNKRLMAKLRKAIQSYANAQENDRRKGGGDPESWKEIENNFKESKLALAKLLKIVESRLQ